MTIRCPAPAAMTMDNSPILYRDFYDVPRVFLVEHRRTWYLFDCPFLEDLDDYPAEYEVFEMPVLDEADWKGSWVGLRSRAVKQLGRIAVREVPFDPTRRATVSRSLFSNAIFCQ